MSEEIKEQASEAENTQIKETISDSSSDVNEDMSPENEHKVLPYPDRVPNVHKGTTYKHCYICLLYTSPSPRDATLSRMPSSA